MRSSLTARTCGSPAAAIFLASRLPACPSETSASVKSANRSRSMKPSRPVPAPYSSATIERSKGISRIIASAIARARATLVGSSSQVAARASKSCTVCAEEGPKASVVMRRPRALRVAGVSSMPDLGRIGERVRCAARARASRRQLPRCSIRQGAPPCLRSRRGKACCRDRRGARRCARSACGRRRRNTATLPIQRCG